MLNDRLRSAVMALDLSAAINRLMLHGDPQELRSLSDDQFQLYLDSCGQDEQAKAIICALVGRDIKESQ